MTRIETRALRCVRNPHVHAWFSTLLAVVLPCLIAWLLLRHRTQDLSIPFVYTNADDIWQLTLSKVLKETGWVLWNPYLGAPGIASWHHNAAAQTSALHSVLMLGLAPFCDSAVTLQQTYYTLNFPLISLTSYFACRLLGIHRLPSVAAGLLFAFTTFRLNEVVYAYLANYFMVPLAIVAVIWTHTGQFSGTGPTVTTLMETKGTLRRQYLLGLAFVILTAACDGYYAFFTLLLLGASLLTRIIRGDWRNPRRLLPGASYVVALLGVALLLNLPLISYKSAHRSEFYPNGLQDSSLVKHPFEAEVYSSTMKTLIAPIPNHRISYFAHVGQVLMRSSDEARKFPNGRCLVPLGSLGALLFAGLLVILMVPALRSSYRSSDGADDETPTTWGKPPRELGDALVSLSLFVFLSSIVGGLGTLVAFAFPTIRAYDRFALFLIFLLYLGGAYVATLALGSSQGRRRVVLIVVIVVVTLLALLDQIPRHALRTPSEATERFMAEQAFVRNLERRLPVGAAVYQFPYSQYLRLSPYYGWGSFSHIRLYLHSHHLRWSNGAAKNSGVDDWHYALSQQPFDTILDTVASTGFAAMVIDRTVVKGTEYAHIRTVLADRGYELEEDQASSLAWVRLRDPGFQQFFDPEFRSLTAIIVSDPGRLDPNRLPESVDRTALTAWLRANATKEPFRIERNSHPGLFLDGTELKYAHGEVAIVPQELLAGSLTCKLLPAQPGSYGKPERVHFELENRSRFDWHLGEGGLPLRIGYHGYSANNSMLYFDNGARVPTSARIPSGQRSAIEIPLRELRLESERGQRPKRVDFVLVQDGSAWFSAVHCELPIP